MRRLGQFVYKLVLVPQWAILFHKVPIRKFLTIKFVFIEIAHLIIDLAVSILVHADLFVLVFFFPIDSWLFFGLVLINVILIRSAVVDRVVVFLRLSDSFTDFWVVNRYVNHIRVFGIVLIPFHEGSERLIMICLWGKWSSHWTDLANVFH